MMLADDLYHFLTTEDYGWITAELRQVMEISHGPIISVLEGGYHTHADANASHSLRKRMVSLAIDDIRLIQIRYVL